MTTFVALLRGINVGGKAMIGMADLRALLESLGLAEVKTLLQSGNLIFRASESPTAQEKALEQAVKQKWGREVDFMIRTAADWNKIVAENPYSREAQDDPSHLVVLLLKSAPDAARLTALKAAIVGREYFHARGRELYLVYPDGIGRSKLTSAVLDRKLGTSGTSRNWNTVLKIAATL